MVVMVTMEVSMVIHRDYVTVCVNEKKKKHDPGELKQITLKVAYYITLCILHCMRFK